LHTRFAWYHPLSSPEKNFRVGRKKKILDLFGPWVPVADLSLSETESLPSVMQPASKVLCWDFEPEEDDSGSGGASVPFTVFDQLMDIHHIDVTGLSLSSTKRGNLYRTHRMMIPLA